MTNGFALNHDKSLQIYFFCLKRRANNYFLKDVESTVFCHRLSIYGPFDIGRGPGTRQSYMATK